MNATQSLATYWSISPFKRPVYVARDANGIARTWSSSRADAARRAPEGCTVNLERAAR